MDNLKLAAAAALLLAGVVGFYYFSEQSTLLRAVVLLVIAAGALTVAMQTAVGRAAWAFVGDARTEMRKVVWPTRKETLQTTLMVVVVVLVFAVLLGLFDSLLLMSVKWLTGQAA